METPDAAQRLAQWMKAARDDAQLTTYQIGDRIGISQSRASRLERGLAAPTPELVRAWAKATGGDPALAERMTDLAAKVASQVRGNSGARRAALGRRQQEMAEIRQAVTVYSELSIAAIPDLLQIPAYATNLMELLGRTDVAAAVAQRMNNQEILYDSSRTFRFLIAESALRYQAGSADVMTAQAEKIITALTLPNVAVAVLPASAALPIPVLSAFIIYEIPDDPLVVVQLLPGEVSYTQSGDVRLYQDAFTVLQSHAMKGRARTISMIRSAMIPETERFGPAE